MRSVIATAHKLADGERLHGLIGLHETPQEFRIETAVGMCDEGPSDAEHTREADEGPLGELGQLAVKPGRQIFADLANLLFDHVKVVEHPFGGGCDGAAFVYRARNRPVRGEQYLFVIAQARAERTPETRLARDGLCCREAARVLLQPLDAEDFLAQDLFAVPMRTH